MRILVSKKYVIFTIFILLFTLLAAQVVSKPVYLAAPDSLPNITPVMQTPEFWINRHPYPDSLLMTPQQIDSFNLQIRKIVGATSNLLELSTGYSEKQVKRDIARHVKSASQRKLHDTKGIALERRYWISIRDSIHLRRKLSGGKPMLGFATVFANQRVFPTADTVTITPLDFDFDEFQNSGFDIGTPVIFYFYSRNKQWIYGSTSTTQGWFRVNDVVLCSQPVWKKYMENRDLLVITAPRAKVWADAKCTRLIGTMRMGGTLPFVRQEEGEYYALLPSRGKDNTCLMQTVYISATEASRGFLPYTPANVYRQAFKLLGAPYGWGDSNGDWDCSSLLKHLYAVFGIELPRNGKSQVMSGNMILGFDKSESGKAKEIVIALNAVGALSLLRLEGHIMLYLGSIYGKPYILHDIWGYRQPSPGKDDDIFVIGKTVVTDMSLGENSKKGSLLERITHLSILRTEP